MQKEGRGKLLKQRG